MTRVLKHPILGDQVERKTVTMIVDGKKITAMSGEMIAAALIANGINHFRYTKKNHEPRGIYCGIGRCTDCAMTVDGIPNVKTCVTEVKDGMVVETQNGVGCWEREGQDE